MGIIQALKAISELLTKKGTNVRTNVSPEQPQIAYTECTRINREKPCLLICMTGLRLREKWDFAVPSSTLWGGDLGVGTGHGAVPTVRIGKKITLMSLSSLPS